jgi:hypothetical protein
MCTADASWAQAKYHGAPLFLHVSLCIHFNVVDACEVAHALRRDGKNAVKLCRVSVAPVLLRVTRTMQTKEI